MRVSIPFHLYSLLLLNTDLSAHISLVSTLLHLLKLLYHKAHLCHEAFKEACVISAESNQNH